MLEIEIRVWHDGEEIDSEFFFGEPAPSAVTDAKIWLGNLLDNMKEDE